MNKISTFTPAQQCQFNWFLPVFLPVWLIFFLYCFMLLSEKQGLLLTIFMFTQKCYPSSRTLLAITIVLHSFINDCCIFCMNHNADCNLHFTNTSSHFPRSLMTNLSDNYLVHLLWFDSTSALKLSIFGAETPFSLKNTLLEKTFFLISVRLWFKHNLCRLPREFVLCSFLISLRSMD